VRNRPVREDVRCACREPPCIEESGGFTSVESSFSRPAGFVLTGEGTAYVAAWDDPTSGIVTPMRRFTADEADVQRILARAKEDGVLAEASDYTPPAVVADAGETTVTLSADGHTWQHRADALGGLTSDTAARTRLADFVHFVSAWAREIRSPPAQRYQPDALRVFALPLPFEPGQGIDVGSWPSGSSVRLSTIGRCSVVRDRAVIRLLEGSTTGHYRDEGTTYVVAAADLLPGDSCSSTHS
jgi:hypothetical protein